MLHLFIDSFLWLMLALSSSLIVVQIGLFKSFLLEILSLWTKDHTTIFFFLNSMYKNNFFSFITACLFYEFQCNNKMCLSKSYICDQVNDCGCIEECDEYDCDFHRYLGRFDLDLHYLISQHQMILALSLYRFDVFYCN